MRVVIVEDQGFYLDLLTDGLRGRSIDVVGRADNLPEALRVIDDTAPDLAVLDISLSRARVDRVHDVEGLRVAELVRADYPDVGLLMLSAHVEPAYAQRLLAMEDNPRAVGYLGKEHLGNLDELIDAFHRIVRGEIVIDSEIISQLMSRRRIEDPLERLTPYQKHILALVAEGHSNLGIAQHLDCKISNVEQHLSTIFDKLGLSQAADHDRRRINLRVLATLTFAQEPQLVVIGRLRRVTRRPARRGSPARRDCTALCGRDNITGRRASVRRSPPLARRADNGYPYAHAARHARAILAEPAHGRFRSVL